MDEERRHIRLRHGFGTAKIFRLFLRFSEKLKPKNLKTQALFEKTQAFFSKTQAFGNFQTKFLFYQCSILPINGFKTMYCWNYS